MPHLGVSHVMIRREADRLSMSAEQPVTAVGEQPIQMGSEGVCYRVAQRILAVSNPIHNRNRDRARGAVRQQTDHSFISLLPFSHPGGALSRRPYHRILNAVLPPGAEKFRSSLRYYQVSRNVSPHLCLVPVCNSALAPRGFSPRVTVKVSDVPSQRTISSVILSPGCSFRISRIAVSASGTGIRSH